MLKNIVIEGRKIKERKKHYLPLDVGCDYLNMEKGSGEGPQITKE